MAIDDKMHSDDRVLVLEPIDGDKVKSTAGMTDSRLWKGGNRVHAIKDPQMSMWSVKYEMGIVPEPLRQKFTKFGALYNFVEVYFEKRGLKIVRVED